MGVLEDIAALAARSDISEPEKHDQIARLRSAQFDRVLGNLPITVTLREFRVTVSRIEVTGKMVTVDLTATRDGSPVPLNTPYIYVNPPLLVPDPTGDIVRRWTDEDGLEHADRFRFAPLQALRAMILDTIRKQVG